MTSLKTRSPVWRISASSSPEALTDWLELQALFTRSATSMQDLVSLFRTGGTIDEVAGGEGFDRGSEVAQQVAETALDTASTRARICGRAYPFTPAQQALGPRRTARQAVYTFMLLLSTYGKDAAKECEDGAGLFEEVARHALGSYIGAETYRFGFPRKLKPTGFRPALDDMCLKMNEGGGSRLRPTTKHQKDAHLDIVAWVPMPDTRFGKFLVFGQCATGWDWPSKLTELQAREWCEHWMLDPPPVAPMRAFMMPHMADGESWLANSRLAGVIFDRCRIAAFSQRVGRELAVRVREWNYCAFRNVQAP
jgi:hypothetical protein